MAGKPSVAWAGLETALVSFGDDVRRGARSWKDVPGVFPDKSPPAARQKYYELDAKRKAGVLTFAAPPAPVILPPAPEPDPLEKARARLEESAQLREQRDLLKAVAGEQNLRAFLTKLVEDAVPTFPAPPPYRAPARTEKATAETLVMQWSDWHAYEVVLPERVRGFNRYDATVFGQRVKRIVETHISIKTRMERGGGWHFPRLALGLNGDFVSGTIHEVERHSDAPNIVMAVYGCAMVLAEAIRDVAAHYERVDCYCTAGNHGRLPDAKRMQQKDPTRSWDTLIYLIAQTALRDCPSVSFHIPDSYSVAFDVEGWRFLQTHGHDVKSWNSIPFYGINRMLGNINALEGSRGTPVAYMLVGHFHSRSSLEHACCEYFVNGSLVGGTEYGLNALGKVDTPCQWMLGVHPEHGVTHRWPLSGVVEEGAASYEVRPWKVSAA